MAQVTKGAVKRQPPKNPIIGQARADEWDRKIDGIILDLAALNSAQTAKNEKLDEIKLRIVSLDMELESAVRWTKIRDVLQIILLVATLAIISFNTSQLWNWN